MPEQDGLMRIFWPLDIPRSDSPGIIVGWRNSGLDVLVVAILEDVDVSSGSTASGKLADTRRHAAWRVP
jgi:phosphatidylinositol glycan class Q protein